MVGRRLGGRRGLSGQDGLTCEVVQDRGQAQTGRCSPFEWISQVGQISLVASLPVGRCPPRAAASARPTGDAAGTRILMGRSLPAGACRSRIGRAAAGVSAPLWRLLDLSSPPGSCYCSSQDDAVVEPRGNEPSADRTMLGSAQATIHL